MGGAALAAADRALIPATPADLGWDDLVDAFLVCEIDSPHTRDAYRVSLRHAQTFLGVAYPAVLTGLQLSRYRAWVIAQDRAPSTQAGWLSALRSFLKWCRMVGAVTLPPDILDRCLRVPYVTTVRPYSTVSPREARAMLRAAMLPQHTVILATLLGTGMRVEELCTLRREDVYLEDETPHLLVRGKGKRHRKVPLGDDLTPLLRQHLTDMPGEFVFMHPDRRGGLRPYTRGGIQLVVRTLAQRAGIERNVSPHALRHTYAMEALRQNGGKVVPVSKLLGHAEISTTQRYLDHLSLADLRTSVPTLPLDGEAYRERRLGG